MDPRPLEDFLPDINILVDGVPRVFVISALRQTCIEFCEQSLLFREKLATMRTSADVGEYELEPSMCDSEVCRILNVWVNGSLLSACTPDQGVRAAASMAADHPVAYYALEPHLLQLTPIPSVAADLEVEIAFAPAFDAENVPDPLYTRHREPIVRGAASRLMLMPKRPWTDFEAARAYRALYWQYLHTVARTEHWTGHGRPVHRPTSYFL